MLSDEQRAEVRRLHYAEHWTIGAIAAHFQIHHSTARKALSIQNKGVTKSRAKSLDPYCEFIKETISRYPTIGATRLQQMLAPRGYTGSVYPLRRLLQKIRPKYARVYQDLQFMPGEVAQVDWADFGKFEVSPGVFRRLQCFVMLLAYSRRIFARVYYNQKMGSLLEAHAEAFGFFDGVPRRIMYDNMKTAVVKNLGYGVEFNKSLIELATHYKFECRACTPRAAWQKGRVERAIRYLRDNFSPSTRQYGCLDELNLQLGEWLYAVSDRRPWPDDTNKTIYNAFADDKARLLELGPIFPFYDEVFCKVNRKSMVQFDCNQYTVPPKFVDATLAVRATSSLVRIFKDSEQVATHKRAWSKGQKVVDPDHIDEVIKITRARPSHQNRSAAVKKLTTGKRLITAWLHMGESLEQQSRLIGELIRGYGLAQVDAAAALALESQCPSAAHISKLLIHEPMKIRTHYQRGDLDEFSPRKHDLSTYDLF